MLTPSGLQTFRAALGIIAIHAACSALARTDDSLSSTQPAAAQPGIVQAPAKRTDSRRTAAGKARHRHHAHPPAKASPPTALPTTLNLKNLQVPGDVMKTAPTQPAFSQRNSFDALAQSAQNPALHWAMGGDLPLPGIDDPALGPKYKDSGFHFGLNYRLSPQLNVSGLAGVKTSGGPVASPDKPTMDQLGIQAQFKF